MTVDQLRDQMRQRFTAISSREWCSVKGVNHAHVSEFLSGKRGPGSDLLAALNLRVDYVRIRGRRALTTPPTPDRIGKDAVREMAQAIADRLYPSGDKAANSRNYIAYNAALAALPSHKGAGE